MITQDTKKVTFEDIKNEVFEELIKRKEKLGLITTQKEREAELIRLESLVEGTGALKPTPIVENSKTNILLLNDDFERTQIDLLIQFKNMDTVFSALDRHKELNSAIVSNLKTNIATLTDKVNVLKDTAMNLSDDVVYVENFRTPDSISVDSNLYTDEDGELIDSSYCVEFDDINEAIKIPKLVRINKLIASNGQKMAQISINKQLGSGLVNVKNPNNSIEKAIDTDMSSYWEENILADEPINVELDTIKYHKHKFGALCEIEITFNSMIEFNEIKLTPYGAYPMDVLCIKKYTTDSPDREEEIILETENDLSSIEIVGPNSENEWCLGKSMDESVLYQFESVQAKRIRIILNQKHYIKNCFIYDKNQYEKNELWFAASENVGVKLKAHQQGMYKAKAFMQKQWVLFNNMLKKVKVLSKLDIEELLFPKKTELVPVTRYEYSYGLYNIGINETSYKNVGVYVSNLISVGRNIGAIELEVDEFKLDHHSISYYVSFSENPTGGDWIEILPEEKLNLIELANSNKLEFSIQKERFFGTRGKIVTLSHIPFIYLNEPDSAYTKINITTPDGVVMTEGNGIRNVTNYSNPAASYMNFTNTDTIEYYFSENTIYFNKAISKDTIIDIDYKSFIDSVRLKAVLRRDNDSNSGITPLLNGYKLTFKTIK